MLIEKPSTGCAPTRQACNLLSLPILAAILVCFGAGPAGASATRAMTLSGTVESDSAGLPGYRVSLHASYLGPWVRWEKLGYTTTDAYGAFEIPYRLPKGARRKGDPLLFVFAESGQATLASAIGTAPARGERFVINERTTVATGTAFAQFIDGARVEGNPVGMRNAARMAANLAMPQSGEVALVLARSPNGSETSTLPTFNSLANVVAGCVENDARCTALFAAATPPGGPAPANVLAALAEVTKLPANNRDLLFALSRQRPVYQPMLETAPTSWLLFIKFTGGFYSEYADTNLMSGPGSLAFDRRGFAWINDNYRPTAEGQIGCAGVRLMKFYPWGESFPGSPFFGGGLSGAGFGITLDPTDRVWIGNFGFEAPACAEGVVPPDPAAKIPATHNSVSLFAPNGRPISGADGFTDGQIWWPQATVSDPQGNIWVANCGNDTVTIIPEGKHWRARNVALPGGQGEMGNYFPTAPESPLIKPFGLAIDPLGRAWVTGNRTNWSGEQDDPAGLIYRVSPKGIVETLPNPVDGQGEPYIRWPMGIAGDSRGNMWVSISDAIDVPCVTPLNRQPSTDPAIVLYPAGDGEPQQFRGGGLTIPWGNAVDGNDTLWVFNFGEGSFGTSAEAETSAATPVSHFCGADTGGCPAGWSTGEAISPSSGYASDAVDRVTGGAIDPSGNLWLLNNWKKDGPLPSVYQTNPGGNAFVIVPGAAGPLATPLIGPPQGFEARPPWKRIQPAIFANGVRDHLTLPQGGSLSVEIELEVAPSLLGVEADWWAAARTEAGWFSYAYPEGSWTYVGPVLDDLVVSFQGPLQEVSGLQILNETGRLPVGHYDIYFGVDTRRDGFVDPSHLDYDRVTVKIN